jgi:excisionase family DNA binding protein
MRDLMTTSQAAEVLGVSFKHVMRLAERGQLMAIRTGPRATVFDRRDVARLAAARRMAPDRPGPRGQPKEPAL